MIYSCLDFIRIFNLYLLHLNLNHSMIKLNYIFSFVKIIIKFIKVKINSKRKIENFFKSFSYWNKNYLSKKITIYKCSEYSLNIEKCLQLKKKYSYINHQIFGFYCFNKKRLINTKKIVKC